MNVRYDGPVAPSQEVVLSDKFELAVSKEEKVMTLVQVAEKERRVIAPAQSRA